MKVNSYISLVTDGYERRQSQQ